MSDTYTCAMCGETHKKGWSDEEASAELGDNFAGFSKEDCAVVCDDCYRKFMGSPSDGGER